MDVQVIRCADDAQLFEHLQISNCAWRRANFGDIAFRGQSNAAWQLIPNAFRPSTTFGYRQVIATGPESDPIDQARAEYTAVGEFLKLADTVGLPVPGDTQSLREPADLHNLYERWPPPEALQTLAIAQHHGVPTRLLDFTYDPYTAAFFAVSNLDKHKTTFSSAKSLSKSIAIWAVDLRFLRLVQEYEMPGSSRIQEVTVPRAGNPNLHAQHGLFLLDTQARFCDAKGGFQSIDNVLGREADHWLPRPGFWPFPDPMSNYVLPVLKIEIPSKFAVAILRRLHREGKTQAHITPNYDGVVAALELIRTNTVFG